MFRNCWVAFPQEVVEDVEENDVSVGQLEKKKKKKKKKKKSKMDI